MENLLHIRLRATSPTLHVDREYTVQLGRDLFKEWYVFINFGRYRTWGTRIARYFNSREAAYDYIHSKLKRRLSAQRRIGFPYYIVSFDGKRDVLHPLYMKVVERLDALASTSH